MSRWLTRIRIIPQWLIVVRLAAAGLAGALLPVVLPTVLPGDQHAACRQAIAEAVNRLLGW